MFRVTGVRGKILTPLETTGGNSFSLEGFEKMLLKNQNFTQGDLLTAGGTQISFRGVYYSPVGIQKSFQGIYISTKGIQMSFLLFKIPLEKLRDSSIFPARHIVQKERNFNVTFRIFMYLYSKKLKIIKNPSLDF